MFGRTVILVPSPARPIHQSVHVTEKRAPTDDSVRLLREMEDQARSRVLDGIKVGDAGFECVVHYLREPISGDEIFRAVVRVGGRNIAIDSRSRPEEALRERLEKLTAVVADRLAREVLAPAIRSLLTRIRLDKPGPVAS